MIEPLWRPTRSRALTLLLVLCIHFPLWQGATGAGWLIHGAAPPPGSVVTMRLYSADHVLALGAYPLHAPPMQVAASAVSADEVDVEVDGTDAPKKRDPVQQPAVVAVEVPPQTTSEPSAPLNMGTLAKDTYYGPSEVSRPALLLDEPDLALSITAEVSQRPPARLKLWVSEWGAVDRVEVEFSDYPPWLNEVLVQHFGALHFEPARLAGTPVKSWKRVEAAVLALP